MSQNQSISVGRKAGLCTITLNRPEKLNSFTGDMAVELRHALEDSAGDPSVRAVLLTGAGRAFSAGQDLDVCKAEPLPDLGDIVRHSYNPVVRIIRKMPKPVVAAVNGVAAGAGANIAFACDIVICADSASFVQSFSRIGLIPDSGGTLLLPRLVGFARASALVHLGDKITAADALAWGLVYKVFPAAQLQQEAETLALKLSEAPTRGIALTKEAFNRTVFGDLDSQLDHEAQLQSAAGKTRDFNEGVKAFLEKREPRFTGQ